MYAFIPTFNYVLIYVNVSDMSAKVHATLLPYTLVSQRFYHAYPCTVTFSYSTQVSKRFYPVPMYPNVSTLYRVSQHFYLVTMLPTVPMPVHTSQDFPTSYRLQHDGVERLPRPRPVLGASILQDILLKDGLLSWWLARLSNWRRARKGDVLVPWVAVCRTIDLFADLFAGSDPSRSHKACTLS